MFISGGNDTFICSTPNDYILYFGTLRRVFAGDIVVAIEAGISEEIKGLNYLIIALFFMFSCCNSILFSYLLFDFILDFCLHFNAEIFDFDPFVYPFPCI